MGRWIFITIFIFSFVIAGGCKKQMSDQEAIRTIIDKDLSGRSRLNTSMLDHEVKQVSIDQDQATARVEFRKKQSGDTMQVDYVLQRSNGEWKVLRSQPVPSQAPDPAMGQPPRNAPGSTDNAPPAAK